jgi:ribonucleoside-triphosphate reductase
MMDLASSSNSFGGSAVSLGSHRVITINFNRIALESNSVENFFEILNRRIEDSAKILRAHKELILKTEQKGLQMFLSNKWINMDRMFSTFGIIGEIEASETLKWKFGNGRDYMAEMLVYLNDKVSEYSKKYGIMGNIEQIPGESMAVRLCKVDKLLYGDKVPFEMYSNQFIPLWQESNIWERMNEDGKYNSLITGGGIVHVQIGEKTTAKQNEKIIRNAIKVGNEHFALNAVYSEFEDESVLMGKYDTHPITGSKIKEYYVRVVGFFVPVSWWNETRREWEFPRRQFNKITDE